MNIREFVRTDKNIVANAVIPDTLDEFDDDAKEIKGFGEKKALTKKNILSYIYEARSLVANQRFALQDTWIALPKWAWFKIKCSDIEKMSVYADSSTSFNADGFIGTVRGVEIFDLRDNKATDGSYKSFVGAKNKTLFVFNVTDGDAA